MTTKEHQAVDLAVAREVFGEEWAEDLWFRSEGDGWRCVGYPGPPRGERRMNDTLPRYSTNREAAAQVEDWLIGGCLWVTRVTDAMRKLTPEEIAQIGAEMAARMGPRPGGLLPSPAQIVARLERRVEALERRVAELEEKVRAG